MNADKAASRTLGKKYLTVPGITCDCSFNRVFLHFTRLISSISLIDISGELKHISSFIKQTEEWRHKEGKLLCVHSTKNIQQLGRPKTSLQNLSFSLTDLIITTPETTKAPSYLVGTEGKRTEDSSGFYVYAPRCFTNWHKTSCITP